MHEINVKINKEEIRSCNGCLAINFDSCVAKDRKKVDTLYDVVIGNMVVCLCKDCLKRLYDAVGAIIDAD